MENLMSQYIDNELSLPEKKTFILKVHQDQDYLVETVSLLDQEQQLRSLLCHQMPGGAPVRAKRTIQWRRFLLAGGQSVTALLVVALAFTAGLFFYGSQDILAPEKMQLFTHRFVIQQTDREKVEIMGSFTNLEKIPLMRTGQGGYWEVTLEIPQGEHRYSFVVDGVNLLPDPTVSTVESDDFGAINSILRINV